MDPLIKSKKLKKAKFITFDVETLNKNGILTPYLYCMYDGKTQYSFFESTPHLLFKQLLRRKYKGYTVYAHNLSRFDIIFLFKFLGDLALNHGYKVDPIIKDDQIISIKIKNNKGIKLVLRDSLLILKDLRDNFNILTIYK